MVTEEPRSVGRVAMVASVLLSVMLAFALMPHAALADTSYQASDNEAVAQVMELIKALPAVDEQTEADNDQVLAAQSAYKALSAEDQTAIDAMEGRDGQSLGRDLETAVWTMYSLTPSEDTSTALSAGTYNASTTPALSSTYSKGKSTSKRDRPWSVSNVTVHDDGTVTGTITVESSTYPKILVGGQIYRNTAAAGGNCTFENVPIKLNTTFYLLGYSSVMPRPIAFSVTTSIDETAQPGESEADKVKALIEALPKDPYKVTADDAGQISAANEAFNALSEQDQEMLDTDICYRDQSYARILESALWSLWSLDAIDNSTSLPDGTYTSQVTSESSMGRSKSQRNYPWKVEKVVVAGGKATATVSRIGGNMPMGSLKTGGQTYSNIASGNGTTFEIPINLNSDLYFSVLSSQATDDTEAIAIKLTTSIADDAQPDAPTPKPGDESAGGTGNGGGDDNGPGGNGPTTPKGKGSLAGTLGTALTNGSLAGAESLADGEASASNEDAFANTASNNPSQVLDAVANLQQSRNTSVESTPGQVLAVVIALLAAVCAGAVWFVLVYAWRERR